MSGNGHYFEIIETASLGGASKFENGNAAVPRRRTNLPTYRTKLFCLRANRSYLYLPNDAGYLAETHL
jgi:hypothetical protein